MITSKECYIYDKCKKYQNNNCALKDDVFCIKLFKLNHLFDEALMSEKQRIYTPLYPDKDGTDRDKFIKLKEIETNIESFVTNGENLFIHSSTCGNGKTEWSLRMIQSYFNSIWHKCDLNCKALFINVPRFLLALKDSITTRSDYVEHIKNHILDVDLVVWDELGIKNATQFEHEHLLNLINTRIDYNKSNIYTSNLNSEELKERLGERLHSRIVNLSTDIELFGMDKRGYKS
jgi:DNA replication protein DnaC